MELGKKKPLGASAPITIEDLKKWAADNAEAYVIATGKPKTPQEGAGAKAPVSAKTDGLTPWEAAREVRLTIRKLLSILHSQAFSQASLTGAVSTSRALTNLRIVALKDALGGKSRVATRRILHQELYEAIQAERAKADEVANRTVDLPQPLLETLHKLSQHLQTQPDLPQTDAENAVRAVAAVARQAMLRFEEAGDPMILVTALKAVGNIVSMDILLRKDVPGFTEDALEDEMED